MNNKDITTPTATFTTIKRGEHAGRKHSIFLYQMHPSLDSKYSSVAVTFGKTEKGEQWAKVLPVGRDRRSGKSVYGDELYSATGMDPHEVMKDLGYHVMNKYGMQESKVPNTDSTTVEINLSSKQLDESFLEMFGTAVKMLLQKMFGANVPDVKIKGKKSDVNAFTNALVKEKSYMQTFHHYGLDNPKTYRSKAKLDVAVSQFERKTGLKWPFE